MRREVCMYTVIGAVVSLAMVQAQANVAVPIEVKITSNAPAGGVYLTPVWVGFHDGSFDSYNGGLSAQPGLEEIAEVGSSATISADFLAGKTYVDTSGGPAVSATVASTQAGSERVDGTVGGGPIAPGTTVTITRDVETSGVNRYFSYASMVLASSDYFVANGDPLVHDLSSLVSLGDSLSFDIGLSGLVNDAGTEINDFFTSAGNPLVGIPGVDASLGADESGVVTNISNPFANFLNAPGGFDFSDLDFNNTSLYPDGIATITISVVPEPASIAAMGLGLVGLTMLRRRRSA